MTPARIPLSEDDRVVLERLRRTPGVHEKALAHELRRRTDMDRSAAEIRVILERLAAAGVAYRKGRAWHPRDPWREPTERERREEAEAALLRRLHVGRGRSLDDLVRPCDFRDVESETASIREILRGLAAMGRVEERDGLWWKTWEGP